MFFFVKIRAMELLVCVCTCLCELEYASLISYPREVESHVVRGMDINGGTEDYKWQKDD